MTHRKSIAAVVALLAAAAVALALVIPPSSAAGKGFFGVSASDVLTARDYKTMKQAGVASLRFGLPWPNIQADPGPCKPTAFNPYDPAANRCNWSSVDPIVAAIAQKHITPLVTVGGTPEWANHRKGFYASRYTPLETKAGKAGWKRFMKAAAERYGPQGQFWKENPNLPQDPVRLWQIWNEQNWSNAFRPKASPKLYGALLKVSAKAIRSFDPKADIMLGGMFGTPGGAGAQAITAWKFLSGLFASPSVRKSFDAVALHPYSSTIKGIDYQLTKLHDVLKAKHDSKAQIWVTELGWGSGGKKVHNHLVFSPKKQKKLLVQSFKLLLHKRKSYNIGGAIWYSWRDPTPNDHTCTFCLSSGLLQNDYAAKPAFRSFKHFAPGP